MNLAITITLFLLMTIPVLHPTNAQDKIIEEIGNTPEKLPLPKGGYDSLQKWINKHITWQQGHLTTVGKVWIETIVDTTGTLTEIKIVKGLTEDTNKEALRLAQQMPPWIPAQNRGKKIIHRALFFIRFGEL